MAGHAHGRGYTPYSHRPSQQSQLRQPPELKTSTQSTASTHTESKPDACSNPPKPRLRTSCDRCQEAKLGCSQEKPNCRRCLRHGIPCVYSPFRRIGRPRKSTSSRSSNGGSNTKARSKNEDIDKKSAGSPTDDLPDLEADSHHGSLSIDPTPAPPSSPASPEHSGGAWYPWTPDGNSLQNGFQTNFDGMDPFSNTTDYLDLDKYFDNQHKAMMDCAMSEGVGVTLDLHSMQLTPPSSVDTDTMMFGKSMPKTAEFFNTSTLLSQNAQEDQFSTNGSSTSTSPTSTGGIDLGANSTDLVGYNASRFNNLASHPATQIPTSIHSTNQAFPSPELTPSFSAEDSPGRTSCSKRCSSSLIQQLASLNQILSEGSNPSLDVVLQVEKDAYSLCRRVISCKPCTNDRSSYLLFSMVTEQVMRLLETIPDEGGSSESCTLLIGKFAIDPDTKASFLKQYLLSRLSRFASLLSEFARVIDDDDSGEYNSNASKDMVDDVYKRLNLLRGIIEMWQ